MSVTSIARLSDHATTLMRERSAKACVILIVEADNKVSQGVISDGASPAELQDALCEAIVYNSERARGIA